MEMCKKESLYVLEMLNDLNLKIILLWFGKIRARRGLLNVVVFIKKAMCL